MALPDPLTRLIEELRALRFDEVVFYRPGPNRDDDFERTASTCSHLCVDASRAVGITRDERPYWRRGARATIERRGPVFDEATFGGWRE